MYASVWECECVWHCLQSRSNSFYWCVYSIYTCVYKFKHIQLRLSETFYLSFFFLYLNWDVIKKKTTNICFSYSLTCEWWKVIQNHVCYRYTLCFFPLWRRPLIPVHCFFYVPPSMVLVKESERNGSANGKHPFHLSLSLSIVKWPGCNGCGDIFQFKCPRVA